MGLDRGDDFAGVCHMHGQDQCRFSVALSYFMQCKEVCSESKEVRRESKGVFDFSAEEPGKI